MQEDVEEELVLIVARRVKALAEQQVQAYIASEEFKTMVDTMKRRERQRLLTEVQQEMEQERLAMIAEERAKMKREREQVLAAEEILLQNKLKIEEQRRREYEQKVQQDADRLAALQRRLQEEVCRSTHGLFLSSYAQCRRRRRRRWRWRDKARRQRGVATDSEKAAPRSFRRGKWSEERKGEEMR